MTGASPRFRVSAAARYFASGLIAFAAMIGLGASALSERTTPQRWAAESAADPGASVETRFDLNSATVAQLQALPTIGPKRAEAIIADREANGPFRSIEDLDRVRGIGPKTVERIRRYLTLSGSETLTAAD